MPPTFFCVFFLSVYFSCEAVLEQCRQEFNIQGMALNGFVLKKFSARGPHVCDDRCDRELTCQSFNYVIETNTCELNNRTKEARPENFKPDPARFYIRRLNNRVPLGSIRELPAQSCQEIKTSEGEGNISNSYWLDPADTGLPFLAYCNMTSGVLFQCTSSWLAFQGSCYKLFTDGKDWNDSKAFCLANGAQLVKIESADENDFIKSKFLAGTLDCWIGLTDSQTEDDWKWSDGSKLAGYINWMAGQPNDNNNNQDCARMAMGHHYGVVYDGEWHDYGCLEATGFICEK